MNTEIPDGLRKIANGRDLLLATEVGLVTNTQVQTLRKKICQTGSFHGAKPVKIGGRLQFAVDDIAKLLRGESL